MFPHFYLQHPKGSSAIKELFDKVLDISSTIRYSKVASQCCKAAQLAIQEAQKAALVHRAELEGGFTGFTESELESVFSSFSARSLLQHNV